MSRLDRPLSSLEAYSTGTATINGEQHPTIIGHRDVNQTICPGQYLADRLPEIRSGTKARQP